MGKINLKKWMLNNKIKIIQIQRSSLICLILIMRKSFRQNYKIIQKNIYSCQLRIKSLKMEGEHFIQTEERNKKILNSKITAQIHLFK